jgi:predicted acyltransferase
MTKSVSERLISLDIFRGIVMFLLLAEHVDLYYLFTFVAPENNLVSAGVRQFFHHEWDGMYFWDLIHPYFTFIIGMAMAFSLKKRRSWGEKWIQTFRHIIYRCLALFVLGIILRCCVQKMLVWELWNILTLFSINIFITFLIFRFRNSTKLIVSIAFLLITELAYHSFWVEGFNQPYIKDHNFGAYLDLILMGKIHRNGWVFFSFLPTTVHMIWGVLAGNLLLSMRTAPEKFKILVIAGLSGLVAGLLLDFFNLSPINKHLTTSAFIMVSGGWCFITYAVLYLLVDIKGYQKWAVFFTVVGINPIFIYLFSRTVGRYWFHGTVAVFTRGFMNQFIASEGIINLVTYLIILGLEWYLCYWLYNKRIFFKI